MMKVLYRVMSKVAADIKSPALNANAWHHRVDGITSVVSLIGVGGHYFGFHWLDPCAGILVSGLLHSTARHCLPSYLLSWLVRVCVN